MRSSSRRASSTHGCRLASVAQLERSTWQVLRSTALDAVNDHGSLLGYIGVGILQRYFQVSPKLLGFGEACPGVLKVSCCGVASWALRNLATSVSMIWICFKVM